MIESAVNILRLGNAPESNWRVFVEAGASEPVILSEDHTRLVVGVLLEAHEIPGAGELVEQVMSNGRYRGRLGLHPDQVFKLQTLMRACAVR